jgi:hypothetical protein
MNGVISPLPSWCAQGEIYLSFTYQFFCVARDSDLLRDEGPGLEFLLVARFFEPVQTGLEPTQPPTIWVPGIFPGGKEVETWHCPPILI